MRCPRAYPSYTIGYEEPLAILKGFIESFDNLQIIGRYGTFRYNNADHSVETGLLAAKNILGESHDLDRVNAEQEYHEIKRLRPTESVAANGMGNGKHEAVAVVEREQVGVGAAKNGSSFGK